MKLKEFGRRGGGVRPSRPPLDPPLYFIQFARILEILHHRGTVCDVL